MKQSHGVDHWLPDSCFGCRVKTIQYPAFHGPAFKPHYNYAVGKYVSTDREFRDALKVCSERNSVSTGIDHNYEPRYGSDLKPMQDADGVLDIRARNLSKQLETVVSYD